MQIEGRSKSEVEMWTISGCLLAPVDVIRTSTSSRFFWACSSSMTAQCVLYPCFVLASALIALYELHIASMAIAFV